MSAVIVEDTLAAGLGQLIERAEDLTPAMKAIAGHLEATTRERFETGTAPDGAKWKPSQRVIEKGGRTLVKSGDLLSSIGRDYGPDFAAVGPERSFGAAVYAAIHQFGGKIRPSVAKALRTPFGPRAAVTIPARPYVGLSIADRDYVLEQIGDHLRGTTGPGQAS